MMKSQWILSFFCLLIMAGCKKKTKSNGWGHYRGTIDAIQFSGLKQIDTSNVKLLQPAWIFHTGDSTPKSTIECNPIVINDIMYLTTPKLSLVALEASTGSEIWRFKKDEATGISRGITYWDDDNNGCIFFSSGNYLYAVDAKNGNSINTFGRNGRIDLRANLGKDSSKISISLTTPGVIYQNLLIIGSATGEGYDASPGHIRAYNTITGKLVWIFHTIPQEGEYGFDTWKWQENENYGGTNNWGGLSLDEKKGVLFVATGSPTYDFYGGNRIGSNLYGNSIIALDAKSGQRIWHYQTVKHDIWDYDLPCAPTLATIPWKGSTREVLMQPTKMGELILLDRMTGENLLSPVETPTPASDIPGEQSHPTQSLNQGIKLVRQGWDTTQITALSDSARNYILSQSRKYISKGMYTPPSIIGTISQPGTRGGMGWSGMSYDPYKNIAYTNCNDFPMLFQLEKLRSREKGDDIYYLGEKLYMLNCASCHGSNRKGNTDGIPALSNLKNKFKINELRQIIVKGKGLMPPHSQFSEPDLMDLILFLRNEEEVSTKEIAQTSFIDKYILKGFRIFTDQEGFPASAPPWGTLNAIDIPNQKIKWTVPLGYYPKLKERGIPNTGTQNFGGCVATSGGLVFIGATADEMFRAFNAETGKELWSFQLPAGGYATPSIYAVDGKEYIVIAAGGGNRNNTPSNDVFIAFTLPH